MIIIKRSVSVGEVKLKIEIKKKMFEKMLKKNKFNV